MGRKPFQHFPNSLFFRQSEILSKNKFKLLQFAIELIFYIPMSEIRRENIQLYCL
ncbi:hypothetical protein M724_00890 [Neisseria gonorrhoeae ATL_2011_01_05]|nr:hypothetical protein M724_00890 [Neisseria gonorrhoeae ATL_2011_01_05]